MTEKGTCLSYGRPALFWRWLAFGTQHWRFVARWCRLRGVPEPRTDDEFFAALLANAAAVTAEMYRQETAAWARLLEHEADCYEARALAGCL